MCSVAYGRSLTSQIQICYSCQKPVTTYWGTCKFNWTIFREQYDGYPLAIFLPGNAIDHSMQPLVEDFPQTYFYTTLLCWPLAIHCIVITITIAKSLHFVCSIIQLLQLLFSCRWRLSSKLEHWDLCSSWSSNVRNSISYNKVNTELQD